MGQRYRRMKIRSHGLCLALKQNFAEGRRLVKLKAQMSNFGDVLCKLVQLKHTTDGGLGAESSAARGNGGLGAKTSTARRFEKKAILTPLDHILFVFGAI